MLPIEYYYLTGKPIKLNHNLGMIYQPRVIDFIDNDMTVEEFAQPFCIRIDIIDVGNNDKLKQLLSIMKDFDLFFIDNQDTLDKLVKCIKMLYKTDLVILNTKKQSIMIDNQFKLDRDNYTYLANIVLDMLCMKPPKKPGNKRKYKDDYRQNLWEKMQKHRAEKEKKDATSMLDICNILVHQGSSIEYYSTFNLTYYQLINSYSTLMSKNGYEEYMMYKTSGQFKMESDVKHWGISNKVRKGIAL